MNKKIYVFFLYRNIMDFDEAKVSKQNSHQPFVQKNPKFGIGYQAIEEDRSKNLWNLQGIEKTKHLVPIEIIKKTLGMY